MEKNESNPKEIVINGYNNIAQKYHDWNNHLDENTNRFYYIQKVHKIIQNMSQFEKVKILDIGCGSGIWTKKLFDIFNSEIIGIDISETQIMLAKKNVPQINNFLCKDIMEIEFSLNNFDIIISLFSIIHLSQEEQLRIFPKIYNWLKPGGLLLLNLSPNIDNGSIDLNWLGTKMYWSSLGNDKYRMIIKELGFEILSWDILNEKEDDNLVKFLWIICKKS